MDYKYWCKFLSPEDLIKWETEIILQNRIYSLGREYNLTDFNNFGDFINYTLNWSQTQDGHEFWESLCHTPSHQLIDYSQEHEKYFYGL
jgi:hypothetical protein